jgi:hypothetical protein
MRKEKELKGKELKNAMKAFTEELYMQIGRDGKHKYSLSKIIDKIRQKFDKTIVRQTIVNWAETPGVELLQIQDELRKRNGKEMEKFFRGFLRKQGKWHIFY